MATKGKYRQRMISLHRLDSLDVHDKAPLPVGWFSTKISFPQRKKNQKRKGNNNSSLLKNSLFANLKDGRLELVGISDYHCIMIIVGRDEVSE